MFRFGLFSDLHFHFNGYDNDDIWDHLIQWFDQKDDSKGLNAIFLAGDIFYKGDIEKYKKIKGEKIKQLAIAAKCDLHNVYICAGNHDLRRSHARALNLEDIIKRKKSIKLEIKDESVDAIYRSSKDFGVICNKITGRKDRTADIHHFFPLQDVNILTLNTSIFAGQVDPEADIGTQKEKKELDSNKLFIYDSKFENFKNLVKKSIQQDKLNIVIGHHAIECFEEDQQKQLSNFLKDIHCDLYLCGHVLKPFTHKIDGTPIYEVSCGGPFKGAYDKPSFIFGEYDSKTHTIDMELLSHEKDWKREMQSSDPWNSGKLHLSIERLEKKESSISVIPDKTKRENAELEKQEKQVAPDELNNDTAGASKINKNEKNKDGILEERVVHNEQYFEEKGNESFEVLDEAYLSALNKPYGLLVTDISGVLFDSKDDGKEEYPEEIIKAFSNLAKCHISVCFTTGRGRTGARQLLLQLAQKIIEDDEDITWDELSRDWTCITHNGAFLLTNIGDSQSGFMGNDIMLQPVLHSRFQHLNPKEFDNDYQKIISDLIKAKKSDMTDEEIMSTQFIKGISTVEPVSFRFSLENYRDESLADEIFSELQKTLQALYEKGGYIWYSHTSTYEQKKTFEYSLVNKSDAVKDFIERFRAINQENILRLSCAGQHGEENDFSFLDDGPSFSVGKKGEKCFSVIDEQNGKRLTGTDATCYLLRRLHFYPSFATKRIQENVQYIKDYADAIRGAKIRSSKIFNYYNSRLAWINFLNEDTSNMLYTSMIFDTKSGAISFSDYEWTLISNILRAPEKSIFTFNEKQVRCFKSILEKHVKEEDDKKKPNLMYFLHTDTHVLFRGFLYYFYLYKAKEAEEGTDSITIGKWKENYKCWVDYSYDFISDLVDAVKILRKSSRHPIGYLARKLLLGSLDNLRNILILLENFFLRQFIRCNKQENNDFLISFAEIKTPFDAICKEIAQLLSEGLELMYEILFDVEVDNGFLGNMLSWTNKVRNLLGKRRMDYNEPVNQDDKYPLFPDDKVPLDDVDSFYTESFPRWREADCFIDNVASIELYLNKIPKNINKITFWGVPYGSIEHPILAYVLCQKKGIISTDYPNYVFLHGKYEERHDKTFKLSPVGHEGTHDGVINVLIDDTITTGSTIDLCAKCMSLNNVPVNNVVVVRYAGLNRVNHFLTNTIVEKTANGDISTLQASAPDVSKFFTVISGMVAEAPYTKLHKYGSNSNEEKPYEDIHGVFDKGKQRIAQYLDTNY